MAKYKVIPGGRTDKVVQGAKALGRATRNGAGTGAMIGAVTTANVGNPFVNTAAGAAVGAVAGAGSHVVRAMKQHSALRRDQFKGY